MPYSLLMALASIASIYYMINTSKTIRAIIFGQVLSVIFVLCPDPIVRTIGLVLYLITVVFVLGRSLTNEMYDGDARLHYLFITIPILTIHLFALLKLPYAGILGLVMIVPLLSIMVLVGTRKKQLNSEMGPLVIIAFDAGIKLLLTLEWMAST
jgi:hypothetical protein